MVNHPNRRRHVLTDCIARLREAGISYEDAVALRRIAMTLRHWHELECGVDGGHIERDEETGKTFFVSPGNTVIPPGKWPIPDRERGALKRLKEIMARYPSLSSYVQGDPRGAALYILRPGDVPAGSRAESCYSNGIPVYK